jgi:hypothetical protein
VRATEPELDADAVVLSDPFLDSDEQATSRAAVEARATSLTCSSEKWVGVHPSLPISGPYFVGSCRTLRTRYRDAIWRR